MMDSLEMYEEVDFDSLLDDLESVGDSTTSEEGSSDSSDQNAVSTNVYKYKVRKIPKKKRLQMYAKEIHIPKVLKQDIRNSYPAMFSNVMNSADFTLIFGFLDTFLAPSIEQNYQKEITELSSEVRYMNGHHVGKYELSKYWCNTVNMGADMVVHLRNPRVHSFSKTNCVQIICDYELKGTKIFEDSHANPQCSNVTLKIEPKEEELVHAVSMAKITEQRRKHTAAELKKRSIEESLEIAEKRATMLEIQRLVEEHLNTLRLRAKPVQFTAVGSFTMYTDEFKRITGIEMHSAVDNRQNIYVC